MAVNSDASKWNCWEWIYRLLAARLRIGLLTKLSLQILQLIIQSLTKLFDMGIDIIIITAIVRRISKDARRLVVVINIFGQQSLLLHNHMFHIRYRNVHNVHAIVIVRIVIISNQQSVLQ